MKIERWAMALAATVLSTTVGQPVALACGGCFHTTTNVSGGTDSTVVTGHRMVFSISPERTVLWDQIDYAGDPEEFAWVLPVKEGAYLELGNDAFLDVLAAGTNTAVVGRSFTCTTTTNGGGTFVGGDSGGFGCGCSSDDSAAGSADGGYGGGGVSEVGAPPDPVTVVSQETVGPFETVTLSTEEPGALGDWLDSHGYVIPDDVVPLIDEYVAEGFDFIALRLIPGVGVRRMQPVRVISPGASPTLPLRLVAAGTGATTALTLFVLAEGRYEAQNFANALVNKSETVWDYASQSSNYSELRNEALTEGDGQVWLTSYARQGSLFTPIKDEAQEGGGLRYDATGAQTLLSAYLNEAGVDDAECVGRHVAGSTNNLRVVDTCDAEGNCVDPEPDEIAYADLVCDPMADDLAAALVGMHLGDVWVTRLEAELPREAFDRDLVLEAAEQSTVAHRTLAADGINEPCEPDVVPASLLRLRNVPGGIATLGLALLGLAFVMRRRGTEHVAR